MSPSAPKNYWPRASGSNSHLPILVDTGAVYAIADRSDAWHERVEHFVRTTREELFVPMSVLPEACYLLHEHLSPKAELAFVRSCAAGEVKVKNLVHRDLVRVGEILQRYADAKLGFVDASVMALAERLDITRILTVDRRDFSIFRPEHCEAFELLP